MTLTFVTCVRILSKKFAVVVFTLQFNDIVVLDLGFDGSKTDNY